MNQTNEMLAKLNTLQLIEAGMLYELPHNINAYDGNYICGKTKVAEHRIKFNKCETCGILEPLIWHHIYTKTSKGKVSTNGNITLTDFGILLGLTRVCPNCHYYIHQLNPYRKIK